MVFSVCMKGLGTKIRDGKCEDKPLFLATVWRLDEVDWLSSVNQLSGLLVEKGAFRNGQDGETAAWAREMLYLQ
jgi:hypothetical protein